VARQRPIKPGHEDDHHDEEAAVNDYAIFQEGLEGFRNQGHDKGPDDRAGQGSHPAHQKVDQQIKADVEV